VLLALAVIITPASAATVPAVAAFDEVFARVNDYTVTVHVHEVKGDQTQDRVYHFWFKRPHLAKSQIVSGPGAGGGAVWTGGDTVSGHQGGILSFIHLKVGLHDRRAVSLRGSTIVEALIQNQVDRYKETKGQLTERDGPTIGGQATTMVELRIADQSRDPGVTRCVVYFSKATHFPLMQIRYGGDKILAEETWSDLHTNVGLKDSDF
jgi:hypothetical protein